MKNSRFNTLLKQMQEIHERKNEDYSNGVDPYSNFTYAASVSSIFTKDIDRTFVTLIAVKLARIAELRKGKTPKNESLNDSLLDLATYAAIWASMFVESKVQTLKEYRKMQAQIAKMDTQMPSLHARIVGIKEPSFAKKRKK